MKQTLKIGITVLVVAALTMSGLALAQTGADEPTDEEVSRGVAAIVEKLAPLIEDGTLSEADALAVAETLADGFGPRPGLRRPLAHGLATAAEVLGMEVEDLAARLREGATLAEIAGDQAGALIAALVAEVEEHLARAVENGRITQEEADERAAEAEERITTFVEEGPPEHPRGFGPGGHGRRGGPFGGSGPGA